MLTRVAPVTTWFDRLAADVLGPTVAPTTAPRGPRTSARSTEHGLELRVELPGVAEEDIDIAIDGRVITVGAARVEGDQRWGTSRQVTIGEGYDLDQVRAHYRHGLLTVVVPPARPTARRVLITASPESVPAVASGAAGVGPAAVATPETTAEHAAEAPPA